MPGKAPDTADSREVRVSEFFETCSTRERGKRFYPRLIERLEQAPSWGEILLSFEDVDFVSPSFLDETLLKLADDRPDLANRVVVTHLSGFTARRLRSILKHRQMSWTLEARDTEGEYRLG